MKFVSSPGKVSIEWSDLPVRQVRQRKIGTLVEHPGVVERSRSVFWVERDSPGWVGMVSDRVWMRN